MLVKNEKQFRPMLAKLASDPFTREGWLFEIKWDGYRAIAEVNKGKVALYSRNGNSFNDKYGSIVKELEQLEVSAVLDGEIVCIDKKGRANFQRLQNYQNEDCNLAYYVFDLLALNGESLTKIPLKQRKSLLKKILPDSDLIKYVDHVEKEGESFFRMAKKMGIEGIIAKDGNSIYEKGRRSTAWQKIKTLFRQEVVIGGYTEPRGDRKYIGALVVGLYQDGKFKFVGHVTGGFNTNQLKELYSKLTPLEQMESPFDEEVRTNEKVHWLKPELVCEVTFSGWTDDGMMRHPLLIGLREDKRSNQVEREKPINQKLSFTNLDKLYFPEKELTKRDVMEYYLQIGSYILPYLFNRPQNLFRLPNGINQKGFFQKNVDWEIPFWAQTELIASETTGDVVNYLVCRDLPTLLYMVNLGCIEINPWSSKVGNLNKPDFMIFDLDPVEVDFKELVNVALTIKAVLDDLRMPNFCKTSGKRGLHIYVPMGGNYEYKQVQEFALLISTLINAHLPELTSINRNPSKRKGKVYLDYLQNRKGQATVAPYSLRPTPEATISTPLHWDEVNQDLDPKAFTIDTILGRLEEFGDVWRGVLEPGVNIVRVLNRIEWKG